MQKFLVAVGLAGAVAAAGTLLPSRADAMTFGPATGIQQDVGHLSMVDKVVEYIYGGHKHCWYADGWHGPGWYWCGYRLRRGLGWGGPAGWRGWAAPVVVVKPPVVVEKRRVIRPRERVITREKVIVR